jgi:hypothetical protein
VTICHVSGCSEHYGCRLRDKGVAVAPSATPSRTQNMTPTPMTPPSHYKNVLTEDRPGGFKMPVLNPDGSPVRHKQASEQSSHFEDQRRRRQYLTDSSE